MVYILFKLNECDVSANVILITTSENKALKTMKKLVKQDEDLYNVKYDKHSEGRNKETILTYVDSMMDDGWNEYWVEKHKMGDINS